MNLNQWDELMQTRLANTNEAFYGFVAGKLCDFRKSASSPYSCVILASRNDTHRGVIVAFDLSNQDADIVIAKLNLLNPGTPK